MCPSKNLFLQEKASILKESVKTSVASNQYYSKTFRAIAEIRKIVYLLFLLIFYFSLKVLKLATSYRSSNFELYNFVSFSFSKNVSSNNYPFCFLIFMVPTQVSLVSKMWQHHYPLDLITLANIRRCTTQF